MGLEKLGPAVFADEGGGGRSGEGWASILRRWLVECPQCTQVWLIVGARENDRHVCKDCGHGFVLSLSATRSINQGGSVFT
jgi:rRNA maturation endonuclease Nob1